MSRNKKLKYVYQEDSETAEFVKENPKMFGWDSESTHDRPGNAQWACKEPDVHKLDKAHIIQEALRTYPKGKQRTALEMYYDGENIKDIQLFMGHKKKHSTIKLIWKMKKRVLAHKESMKRKKLSMKSRKIVAKNTFTFQGESKSVFLVFTPKTNKYIWVDNEYRILPEDTQDYLDQMLVTKNNFLTETEVEMASVVSIKEDIN